MSLLSKNTIALASCGAVHYSGSFITFAFEIAFFTKDGIFIFTFIQHIHSFIRSYTFIHSHNSEVLYSKYFISNLFKSSPILH